MVYNIEWLDEARWSLDAEMEYVFAEFGQETLAKVYDNLMERVSQLQVFPRIGVRREDLDYQGYEMRMLHVKKISECNWGQAPVTNATGASPRSPLLLLYL